MITLDRGHKRQGQEMTAAILAALVISLLLFMVSSHIESKRIEPDERIALSQEVENESI